MASLDFALCPALAVKPLAVKPLAVKPGSGGPEPCAGYMTKISKLLRT